MSGSQPARFLTLADVAETLAVSAAQAYALVRSGELRALKVGGRGQWRVERTELERYIERAYAQTAQYLSEQPSDGGGQTQPVGGSELPGQAVRSD